MDRNKEIGLNIDASNEYTYKDASVQMDSNKAISLHMDASNK